MSLVSSRLPISDDESLSTTLRITDRRVRVPMTTERKTQRPDPWIGPSAIMATVRTEATRFARTSAPILITGESGTGKEMAARYIHQSSPRADQPFIAVNCAALTETLLESELFGHEKGAFTGANESHVGYLERAANGTLLLDEITEIPLTLQAKLLRVLEQEEFHRVGSCQPRPLQARILATTNRCFKHEVEAGRFRADLYFRLNVLELQLPALCERREDIPPLADFFVNKFRSESTVALEGIHPLAVERLQGCRWPGNVRQLRNVIRRACILANLPIVTWDDCAKLIPAEEINSTNVADKDPSYDLFHMPLRDAERVLIIAALQRHHGNRTAAARDLGVTPRTLHNRFKQDPQLLAAALRASANAAESLPRVARSA